MNPSVHHSASPFRQSVNPSIPQSVSPSIRQSIIPPIRQSVNPSIRQSFNPSIHHSANPAIRQSLNPSILQSVSLSSPHQQRASNTVAKLNAPIVKYMPCVLHIYLIWICLRMFRARPSPPSHQSSPGPLIPATSNAHQIR